jgi:hypothetical protein
MAKIVQQAVADWYESVSAVAILRCYLLVVYVIIFVNSAVSPLIPV